MSPRWSRLLLLVCLAAPSAHGAERCPNLVIVLDRSGSMSRNPAGAVEPDINRRKWTIAVRALKDLLAKYDGQLPIGLSLYSSDGSCGAGSLLVPPAYGTRAQIAMQLDASSPAGNTPTSSTVRNVAMHMALRDSGRKQFILLITDGEPNCVAAGQNAIDDTVAAITAARNQRPPITTFVVGFGALPPAAHEAMNRMAVAGGAPDNTNPMYRYYRADDAASLTAALDAILQVVTGEFGMAACDDRCYSHPCPSGQKCIRGTCQADPCAGRNCPAGQFCHTDGSQPGECVSPCLMSCPAGQRCDRGACVPDPCGGPCGPERRCNQATGACEPDPACQALMPRCRPPLFCVNGQCVDDPCTLVSCPAGTSCVPWSGMCQAGGARADGGEEDPAVRETAGGCSCRLGVRGVDAAPLLGLAVLLGVLPLRRRRGARF